VQVEVTRYIWPTAHASDDRMSDYSLGLTLTPRRLGSQIRYYDHARDTGAFADLGRLFFVPADMHLQGRAPPLDSLAVFCRFDRDWFEGVTGLGHDWNAEMLSACIDIGDSRLIELMSRLGQEAMAPGLASCKLAEGLGLLTAVDLARHLRRVSARSKSDGPKLTPWQIRRITNYFDRLAVYAPDIAEVAGLCGVSDRHLRRLFKETTDRTIYEHARDIWTAKAKRMLSDTELPLKEISARLGFSDPGSFSVAFRRASGVAPRRFRQQSKCARPEL